MSSFICQLKTHLKTRATWYFWAVFFPLLFLATLQLPRSIAINSHDAGSQAIIEYWTTHGYQYGKDIIQNVGPLGFLAYPGIYTGFLDIQKLILNITLTLFLAFFMLDYLVSLKNIKVSLLFVAGILFSISTPEANFYLLSLLTAAKLISANHQVERILAVAVLSILALTKGIFLFVSFVAVTVSIVIEIRRNRHSNAIVILLTYFLFLGAIWTACGQRFDNFPEYVQAMAAFSSGYNDAMAVYEKSRMTNIGFLTLVLCSGLIASKVFYRANRNLLVNLCVAGLVEAFLLFLAWKHGFVRADEHMVIFFQFCLMANVVLAFRNYDLNSISHASPSKKGVAKPPTGVEHGDSIGAKRFILSVIYSILNWLNGRLIICICITILSGYGICRVLNMPPKQVMAISIDRIRANAIDLPRINIVLQHLAAQMEQSKATMALPLSSAFSRPEGIGYFGTNPAAMVFNEFKYLSSPSNISFASWNNWIMKKNEAYYQDESRAPNNLLLTMGTIDSRVPGQDDSLAQLEIFHRYSPILLEKEYVLMKRDAGTSKLILRELGKEAGYKLGDWITVPAEISPLWIKIDMKESVVSKGISVLYKPSKYEIKSELLDGSFVSNRYMPRMGGVGFLLNPQINDNNDLINAYLEVEYEKFQRQQLSSLKGAKRIMISCAKKISCSKELSVQFYSVEGLKFGSFSLQDHLKLIGRTASLDVVLVDASLSQPIQFIDAYGEKRSLFHAPSKVVMQKEKGGSTLSGNYGLAQTSYEGEGQSDGVIVKVKFSSAATGQSKILWERVLDPARLQEDRGMQKMDIALPDEKGTVTVEVNPRMQNYFDHFVMDHLSIR